MSALKMVWREPLKPRISIDLATSLNLYIVEEVCLVIEAIILEFDPPILCQI